MATEVNQLRESLMKKSQSFRYLPVVIGLLLWSVGAFAAKISTSSATTTPKRTTRRVTESGRTQSHIRRLRHSRRVSYSRRRHRYYERFTAKSFANTDL